MLVTPALKEECVVVVLVWSVLMLMLCSFLQFGICRALEYLISHLITPGQLSRDTPDQGRGWDFVKIFSISERLTQQWNISLWNYISTAIITLACCSLSLYWESLVPFSAPCQFAWELWSSEAALSGQGGPGQCGRCRLGHQSCRVTGAGLASHQCHPRHLHGEHLNRQFVFLLSCPEVCALGSFVVFSLWYFSWQTEL